MPNYNLVINPQFNPFSYQELMDPVLRATQAHQDLENKLSDLSSKASVWENMADEQRDYNTYKMYKQYADDLNKQIDSLAANGLTIDSRKGLMDMKSRYSKEILPIEQAFAARNEEMKSQYAGKANGIVYEGDASTASLDRYLGNPAIRYNQANSKEGFSRISSAASALAKKLNDYGNGKSLDNYTKTWLQTHGYKDTDVFNAINDIQDLMNGNANANTNGILRGLLNDEMKVSGVSKWDNQSAKLDYLNRVAPALYQAVGQTQVSPYENYEEKLNAQMLAKLKYANANKGELINKGSRINPLALRSSQEIEDNMNEFNDYVKDGFIKYDYENKQYVLTNKGANELKNKRVVYNRATNSYDYKNDFNYWWQKNIGRLSNNNLAENPTINLNRYYKKNYKESYDTYHSTEYDRQIGGSYSTDYTKQLWSNASINGLREVNDYNGKSGWELGDWLTQDDLKKYKVSNIRYSKYGNTAILQDENHNTKRVLLPKGINTTNEDRVKTAINNADFYGNILNQLYKPKVLNGRIATDKKGNIIYTKIPLTEEDKYYFENKRKDALEDMYTFGSQIVVPSKTKDEEFDPLND